MKYAVIAIGGKQYKVSEGDIIDVNHLGMKKDDAINFDKVLLYVDGEIRKIASDGKSCGKVKGIVLEEFKGEKIRVAKFKAKAKYRRVRGYRSSLTKIKIESIA